MLNQVVLVGRLVRDPEVEESENGKKHSSPESQEWVF